MKANHNIKSYRWKSSQSPTQAVENDVRKRFKPQGKSCVSNGQSKEQILAIFPHRSVMLRTEADRAQSGCKVMRRKRVYASLGTFVGQYSFSICLICGRFIGFARKQSIPLSKQRLTLDSSANAVSAMIGALWPRARICSVDSWPSMFGIFTPC